MGILSLLTKRGAAGDARNLVRLPTGSFTVDPSGKIVASTLPHSFPESQMRRIADLILATFQSAREARIPLTEVIADYATLRLTARELRGGAIIFLAPRSLGER